MVPEAFTKPQLTGAVAIDVIVFRTTQLAELAASCPVNCLFDLI